VTQRLGICEDEADERNDGDGHGARQRKVQGARRVNEAEGAGEKNEGDGDDVLKGESEPGKMEACRREDEFVHDRDACRRDGVG